MRAADHFHVGIVVDDLDAALDDLADLFGYEWCPILAVETPVSCSRRARPGSTSASPIRRPPQGGGDPEHPRDALDAGRGLGHPPPRLLVRRRRGRRGALEARGYAAEATGVRPDGTPVWAYHRSPRGPRIELVSRELQAGLEQYWASG